MRTYFQTERLLYSWPRDVMSNPWVEFSDNTEKAIEFVKAWEGKCRISYGIYSAMHREGHQLTKEKLIKIMQNAVTPQREYRIEMFAPLTLAVGKDGILYYNYPKAKPSF